MLLDDPTYHLFGVAETRLDESVESSLVRIQGYSVIRQDRNRGGGAILLYVHNKLKAKVLYSSETTQKNKSMRPEYLYCSVWEGDSPHLLVVLVYRPPDVKIKSDPNFARLLRITCSEFSNKIIMGDLNADMRSHSNSDTKDIHDLMVELSLKTPG